MRQKRIQGQVQPGPATGQEDSPGAAETRQSLKAWFTKGGCAKKQEHQMLSHPFIPNKADLL